MVDSSLLGPPLPSSSILAILTSRGDGTFHWAIGLTGTTSSSGFSLRTFRKCHATQLNGPGWEFEDVEHDIGKLQHIKPLCVAVKIGESPSFVLCHIKVILTSEQANLTPAIPVP
ncbi:unnamed protein product [Peniophora sp. CBMAI 1063]|nr:unnamed protein product [Peniophora sp. CBMAI 1063]